MNLRTLAYIVAIAEEKNISRAAERLYVSQSTLSIFLKKLEKELDMPLFLRTGHRLELTPAGEDYVNTAKEILSMKDELYMKLSEMSGNRSMRIGIASRFLFQMFSEMISGISEAKIRITIQEGRSLQLLSMLQKQQLDTVIAALDEVPVIEGCSVECVNRERMAVLLPPLHPAAAALGTGCGKLPVLTDMQLLKAETWALFPPDTFDYRIAVRMFRDYGLEANIKYELYNTQSICRMVKAGTCLSVVPEYTIPWDMGLPACRPPKDYYRYQVLVRRTAYRPSEEENAILGSFIEQYLSYCEESEKTNDKTGGP